jgi:hypothetical protein
VPAKSVLVIHRSHFANNLSNYYYLICNLAEIDRGIEQLSGHAPFGHRLITEKFFCATATSNWIVLAAAVLHRAIYAAKRLKDDLRIAAWLFHDF